MSTERKIISYCVLCKGPIYEGERVIAGICEDCLIDRGIIMRE